MYSRGTDGCCSGVVDRLVYSERELCCIAKVIDCFLFQLFTYARSGPGVSATCARLEVGVIEWK